MLAGLSQCWIFKIPPDFWANAGPALAMAIINAPVAAHANRCRVICALYRASSVALPIQPYILEAPAVVDAVDHHRQPFHLGLAARRADIVKDDRPGSVFLQLLVDLPHQLLALCLVRHRRLFVELLVELGVAVTAVVARRATGVILVELLVRVVNAATRA